MLSSISPVILQQSSFTVKNLKDVGSAIRLQQIHLLQNSLQLVAWILCGDSTRQKAFWINQKMYLAMHAKIKPPKNFNPQEITVV